MYGLIYALVFLVIALIITGIRVAVRRSQSASAVSQFRHHLAAIRTPFPMSPDERVVYSIVARDLGAVRGFPDGSNTEDNYPGCYPLIYLTSSRLVILMSTSNKPTAVTGTYPASQVNLHERIGEQFSDDSGGFVSSASCRWDSIGSMVVHGPTIGFTWTDREGVGAALVTVIDDPGTLVNTAIQCITDARQAASMEPVGPVVTPDESGISYNFTDPAVVCASCGVEITATDRFCTGCGASVRRMETT